MILSEIGLSSGDWIAMFGVIISLFLGTFVVNNQTKNRVQKDFFIKEIEQLKHDYSVFISGLRSEQFGAEAIRDGFNIFSHRITTLNEILNSEYYLSQNTVFKSHGAAQVLITGLHSVEEQYEQQIVRFTPEEKTYIDLCLNNINKSMMELVVCVNRAETIKIWDRQDFYNQ